MAGDAEYGWNVEENVHVIYEGQEKDSDKLVYISTWQSIYDQPAEYFAQFEAILVDEAHHAQAKSIKSLMEASKETNWRIGCTGTLNDTLTHRLTIEGLFGEVYQATTTKELMDQDYLAKLKIKSIVVQYNNVTANTILIFREIQLLSLHKKRNIFCTPNPILER
jgi:superfamily II DNA or RNA helicase